MNMQFCAQPNFDPAFNFSHGQVPTMEFPDGQYPIYQTYHGLQYLYPPHQARDQLLHDRNVMGDAKTESKPRLSKEEVEKLEKVFQENPKPSSSVKAQLADGLGLERPRINNWFQNRRAKAKQERKQEEYEARKAAEKENAGSAPQEDGSSGSNASDSEEQQTVETPADLDGLTPAVLSTKSYEDSHGDETDSHHLASPVTGAPSASSHQDDNSTDFQSPLSLNLAQHEPTGFTYALPSQPFSHASSVQGYPPLDTSHHDATDATSFVGLGSDGLPSPAEQTVATGYQADHYMKMMSAGYPSSGLPYFHSTANGMSHESLETFSEELENAEDRCDESIDTTHSTPSLPHAMPSEGDSFKSPPPPSDIASRRNLQRPAALQTASLRSRSYNLGSGPKTSLDSPRRGEPSSPATAMRRIASASGGMAGRIQKQVANPRSPMFLNRNAEAFLQYHARSPMGSISSALGNTAPPTPMTPMVASQPGNTEPSVTSNCSDDEAFILGTGMSSSFMHDLKSASLKTPPGTPGIMTHFAATNFNANPFSTGVDFSADQPLVTPYFQTEFPELSLNVPSYVELSDNSLPSTPLYPNMMSTAQEGPGFQAPVMGPAREYDWDTNESVTSSKSSPGQPRSRQIQFTQNMTPQDYNYIPEK